MTAYLGSPGGKIYIYIRKDRFTSIGKQSASSLISNWWVQGQLTNWLWAFKLSRGIILADTKMIFITLDNIAPFPH